MSDHDEEPKSPAEAIRGQMIAHYRVARPLGSGGMGEMFPAENTKLDRPVALQERI